MLLLQAIPRQTDRHLHTMPVQDQKQSLHLLEYLSVPSKLIFLDIVWLSLQTGHPGPYLEHLETFLQVIWHSYLRFE